MSFVTFRRDASRLQKARRDDFYTQLIRRGIFFTPHHHGYICYRHTPEDLDVALAAMDEAMAYVSEKHGPLRSGIKPAPAPRGIVIQGRPGEL